MASTRDVCFVRACVLVRAVFVATAAAAAAAVRGNADAAADLATLAVSVRVRVVGDFRATDSKADVLESVARDAKMMPDDEVTIHEHTVLCHDDPEEGICWSENKTKKNYLSILISRRNQSRRT